MKHLWTLTFFLSQAVVNLCCGVVHLRLEPSTLNHKYTTTTAISTTTTGTPWPPTVPLHAHHTMFGAKPAAMGLFPTHPCTPQLARQAFARSSVGYSKVCFAQVTVYPGMAADMSTTLRLCVCSYMWVYVRPKPRYRYIKETGEGIEREISI